MRNSTVGVFVCGLLFFGRGFAATPQPVTIDFEDQPAGPCCFADAGGAQYLTYNIGGFTAAFSGGVILTGESNQTTDDSNVYATASFGSGLSNPLTIQFGVPVQNFQIDILNALAGTYTMADNAGHSENFSLATTGGSLATESFTTAGTTVTVNYDGPGADGDSFDFAIDNVVATPSSCAAVVENAITLGIANGGATETAAFTPNSGLSLSAAAADCNVASFNWQQVVTTDPYPPKDASGNTLSAPYLDPPVGGYFGGPADNAYPYYWNSSELAGGACDLNGQSVTIQTATTLTFCDTPAEPQLKAGQFLGFDTTLMGITSTGSTVPLFTFDWTSDFNGTVNQGSARGNPFAPDPNSGTGGVTVTSINGIPAATPEPSTLFLLGPGCIFLLLAARRRRAGNVVRAAMPGNR